MQTRNYNHMSYVPDHASFGAFMLSGQMKAPVKEVASAIMEYAVVLTPRGKASKIGSHLADSYSKHASTAVVNGEPRVSYVITNDSEYAAAWEFGSITTARRRMLGRAGAAFGDLKPEGSAW